jgi:hypothetical protein
MGDPGVHAKHRLIKDLKKFETKALLNIYFMYRRGGRELSSDTLIPLRLPENFLVIFEALDLVLDQQKDSFLVMCSKLRLNLAVFKRDYYKILDNLFLREPTWPRVLTAAAFTYALGDFCQVNGPEEAWDLLPDHLHQYLGQDVFSAALQRQGGLDGFREFCEDFLGKSYPCTRPGRIPLQEGLKKIPQEGLSFTNVLSSIAGFSIRMALGSNEVCS